MDERVALIRSLVAGQPAGPGGPAGLLQRVCSAATLALPVSGAGVSVMTEGGVRGVSAASDPHSARIEELQFVLGKGPCMDACHPPPGAGSRPRHRRGLSLADVHPGGTCGRHPRRIRFSLQIGATRLGVLDLFRVQTGALTGDDLPLALTFADVTVTALLDQQEDVGTEDADDDLAAAVEHRAELFQAQGMIMVQLGVTIDEAMARMRAYAFAESRPLDEIARDVVARRLRFDRDHP